MSAPATRQNPTLPTPFHVFVEKLTPQQALVVTALAQGRSVTRAAADAGLHRSTVYAWKTSPDFCAALKEARREFAAAQRDQVRDLSTAALDTLTALLASPDTPPAIRLKAALAVLDRPRLPDPPAVDLEQLIRAELGPLP